MIGNLVAAHREPNSTKAEGLLVRFTFKKSRLELAERRTTGTVTALGAMPKML